MALIQKAFSDIITFSRSSNATRIGPNGLVQYAPHNLLLQSENFSVTWAPTRAIIATDVIASPNGTVTADKLYESTAASNTHYVAQTLSLTSGTTYTSSVYAKAGERTIMRFRVTGTGTWADAYFNLATGTVVSGTGTITSVGNGWYRCSISGASDLTGTNNCLIQLTDASGNATYTGDGVSGLYLWGAQLAVGPLALDYTPTTTAAVYGPRFDYDGSGVTSVDPIARNLVLYSQEFDNAAWSKTGVTVTANTQTAPDGTVTADTITGTVSGYSTYIQFVSSTISAASTVTNTYSIYLKAGTVTSVRVYAYNQTGGLNIFCDFNLTAITATPGGNAMTPTVSITDVGNGWRRCSFSGHLGGSAGNLGTLVIYADNGTFHVWGAQVELGPTATGYMVSGATNGLRAVPVVTGNATPRGLLIEEQRTNLLLQSQDFSTTWTNTRTTETVDATTAPVGTVTADKLVEDTSASNDHVITQTATVSISTTYTYSVFIKASERTWAFLNMVDVGVSSYRSWFNLSTGVVGTSDSGNTASIQSVGNGWYRCIVSRATTGSQTSMRCEIGLSTGDNVINYTGNGTSGLFIWGAQLEAGTFATSYIPTLASTVTRSADVASVNTLSPWYNATEGTLFAEFDQLSSVSPSNQWIATISDGTSSNYIGSLTNPTNFRAVVVSGGVSQASMINGAVTANTPVKTAQAFKADDFAATASGAAVVTDTSGTIPTVSQLSLGSINGSNILNGHLRRIAFYPRRLSNAELQALTA